MKTKELIKQYCKERGLDEKMVSACVLGMYKLVHKKQEEMSELHITIPAIGVFNMKTWKLDKLKHWVDARLGKYPNSISQERVDKVQRAIELYKAEKRLRDAHWEKRKQLERTKNKNNESEREVPEGMGE